MAAKDPRGSSRYKRTAHTYAKTADPVCCLCGSGIDLQLPRNYPGSWTIEHGVPIRRILAMTDTWDEAVALCCDTSLWTGLAHRRCQSKQGGKARHEGSSSAARVGSRPW